MASQDDFGPHLRSVREQRGITLLAIAERTNVDVEMWAAMERDDFSRWPAGIFARAFVAEYARLVGLNPDSTVDDFCRRFPQGDRRRGNIIRAKAELLGVRTELHEDVPGEERRRQSSDSASPTLEAARRAALTRRWRLAAAGVDAGSIAATGLALTRLLHTSFWGTTGTVAFAYYIISLVGLGCSPGAALVTAWLRHAVRAELRALGETALLRVRRTTSH